MTLYTIGCSGKRAERFFGVLREAGVRRLVDVRLDNTSQLAGFAKRHDLAYFATALCDIAYTHALELAPTREMLDEYRKRGRDWARYERRFELLMRERRVQELFPRETLDGACLLCSEPDPEHCHRRLVAEHLAHRWRALQVVHLR